MKSLSMTNASPPTCCTDFSPVSNYVGESHSTVVQGHAAFPMQQAYAACVPAPPAAVPLAGLKLAVALLLLAIPIGLGVAWRERHGGDGWLAGAFAAVAWILGLLVLALTAVGVRFLFS